MSIKEIKKGDFLKLKGGAIEHKVIEVGNDWRNGMYYVTIHDDVTGITKTLIDISNYDVV